jgi:FixJ family two-component response regulator
MTEPAAIERQVALLVAWGATRKQVADLLHLSPAVVDGHLARLGEEPLDEPPERLDGKEEP